MKVCVIGGGAAGMMCAIMIARRGHNVSLYEKNEKLGKKIYITGKGRCNVTNLTTGNEFLKNVVGGQKFVMGAITRFDSEDTMDFFEDVQAFQIIPDAVENLLITAGMGDENPVGTGILQILFHVFGIGQDDLRHFAAVFFGCVHLAVFDNNAGMQLQHTARKGSDTAAAAASVQEGQSVNNKTGTNFGSDRFDMSENLFCGFAGKVRLMRRS